MFDTQPIVFLVDEDASASVPINDLIRSEGWRSEIFRSGHEFLTRRRCLEPCCVVVNVGLADLAGLELQARVMAERNIPIVFIANCRDVRTGVRAMKAGAADFLTQPYDAGELLSAMRNAIECSRATVLHDAELRALREQHELLTVREKQVMALVVSGRLNKQVGGELGISEVTVKAHRGQVMRKMQADSFAQLVGMVARLGISGASVIGTASERSLPKFSRLPIRGRAFGGVAASAALSG